MPITGTHHPARTREMSLVNRFGPLRFSVRIDLKDDGGNLQFNALAVASSDRPPRRVARRVRFRVRGSMLMPHI